MNSRTISERRVCRRAQNRQRAAGFIPADPVDFILPCRLVFEKSRGGKTIPNEAYANRRSAVDQLTLLLATGFGLGRIPRAPGTFGSLLGLPLAWGVQQLPPLWQYVAAALACAIGVPICDRGAKLLNAKDPGAVVWDEIAAFPVMFLFVPLTVATAVAGFLLFRLLDISKPWPCRQLERLPGGLGIMTDDLVAGLYAGGLLWCIARWLPPG